MNRMKVSERFALNQWLSDYPDTMSYDAILQALRSDGFDWRETGIYPWELIEDEANEYIAELIEDTCKAFKSSADDLCSGIKLSDVMEGACDD